MKKATISILIGTVVCMILLPNPSLAIELTGGLKIGANFANLYGEDLKEMEEELGEDFESRLGICIGGFITFNISEMFAIQPEVLYSMKGSKAEGTLFGETFKVKFNISYLEIPVLVKLRIPTQGNVKPSLFAGPSLAIKLSGKSKVEYAGESEEEDIEELKNTDFGLIIGAGVDLGFGFLGQGKITVDLRYNFGLTKISEENDEVKNKVISLMIGYSF